MAASLDAAKAVNAEANGKATRMFMYKYTDDDGEQTISLAVPRKYKRLKFAKLIAKGDIISALGLLFPEEDLERLEEMEMDDTQFDDFMEALGNAIGGTSAKN